MSGEAITRSEPFPEGWQQMTKEARLAWLNARGMHTMGLERDWEADRVYYETGLPLDRHTHSYECSTHTMGCVPFLTPSDLYISGPVPVPKAPSVAERLLRVRDEIDAILREVEP